MKIFEDISEMQRFAEDSRNKNLRIGLVPTMGYLHKGHLSLMRSLRKKCDILVVSIFINPAQFGKGEDLEKYPRDFERDENLCRQEEVDILFYPPADQMYPEPYITYVTVEQLSIIMCGISRPTHFRGVTTVVAKLFNIVKPHVAIFGEKDYQQAIIIKRMVIDLNFGIAIETAPIIRESDGLALSSRNKYLNATDRKNAAGLYKSLRYAQKLYREGEKEAAILKDKMEEMIRKIPHAKVDYIEIFDPDTLESLEKIKDSAAVALAVFLGGTRLIDNILIHK